MDSNTKDETLDRDSHLIPSTKTSDINYTTTDSEIDLLHDTKKNINLSSVKISSVQKSYKSNSKRERKNMPIKRKYIHIFF
jgi:hypothetical protein